jgi:hypothetical protein
MPNSHVYYLKFSTLDNYSFKKKLLKCIMMILEIFYDFGNGFSTIPFEKEKLCNDTHEMIIELMNEYKKCQKSPLFSVIPCVTYKERYIRLMYKFNDKCFKV